MVQTLDLTQIINPAAQTIRVTEPGGVTLTGIGLYFYSKPPSDSPNLPVTIEMRPVTEGGIPSSYTRYPGTVVTKARSAVTAQTTFDAATGETKFDFEVPLYVPENTEVALVIHTNAAAGEYQIWVGDLGEFEFGTTEKRITKQPYVGSFFASSNGTTWTALQSRDIAFKVYRAQFRSISNNAVFYADVPPPEQLSYAPVLNNPLFFTSGDSDVKVLHGAHGLQNGDTVKLTGLDSGTEYAGVFGHSLLGKRTIKNVDPFGYTITADSAADSSVRSGGNNIFATGQMPFDKFKLISPVEIPDNTSIAANLDFKTHQHWGSTSTKYSTGNTLGIVLNEWLNPSTTGVIMNQYQESDYSVPDGSLKATINLSTQNINVAPYINSNLTQFYALHNLIDNPDSNGAFQGSNGYDSNGGDGYNMVHTINYVAETAAALGSATARHVTKVISLTQKATSIKLYIDALRPAGSEFDVYYRTANSSEIDLPIGDRNWVRFSKNSATANRSNYEDFGADDRADYREYFFSQFDLPDFDLLQVKITMYSTNSKKVPLFQNLRILSTI